MDAGDAGGETLAVLPVILRSSGLVLRFSGSSVNNKKYVS